MMATISPDLVYIGPRLNAPSLVRRRDRPRQIILTLASRVSKPGDSLSLPLSDISNLFTASALFERLGKMPFANWEVGYRSMKQFVVMALQKALSWCSVKEDLPNNAKVAICFSASIEASRLSPKVECRAKEEIRCTFSTTPIRTPSILRLGLLPSTSKVWRVSLEALPKSRGSEMRGDDYCKTYC